MTGEKSNRGLIKNPEACDPVFFVIHKKVYIPYCYSPFGSGTRRLVAVRLSLVLVRL
ncbi:hypothetical protein J2Z66_008557 [Paenibacillus eucommiae]|uniref:Uncharacterized protein n=1 Tax=Paenibacillus eucommiae TaxID=1355755 RepID=A0ABS4JAJ3_9BACL|nr:hypothetical protein [Paenibacillus eucommiae]